MNASTKPKTKKPASATGKDHRGLSYSIFEDYRTPRVGGSKYFLGKPLYGGDTPKTPSSNKHHKKKGTADFSNRRVGRSYVSEISKAEDLLNYSGLYGKLGGSQPKKMRSNQLSLINSSNHNIYRTYDLTVNNAVASLTEELK